MVLENLAGTVSGIKSGFMTAAYYFFYTLILLMPVAALAIYLMIMRPYRIKAFIFEKRGDGSIKITEDKVKPVKKSGVTVEYVFFKTKKKMKPPEYRHLYTFKGKKDIMFCEKFDDDTIIPMKISVNDDGIAFDPVERDVKFYHIVQAKKTIDDYQHRKGITDMLKDFAPYAFMAVLMILLLILFGKFNDIAGALNNVAGAIKQVAPSINPPPPP